MTLSAAVNCHLLNFLLLTTTPTPHSHHQGNSSNTIILAAVEHKSGVCLSPHCCVSIWGGPPPILLSSITQRVSEGAPPPQLYEMFPWMMKFIPGEHQKTFICMKKLLQYVQKRVEMNKETLDENNPRDYVDVFLIKMEKEKTNPKSEFQFTNLVSTTLQIFFAGVDTVSTTITYSLLLLMKYPDVLDKVHKEIDMVIGRDRCPKIQDRIQMPFTDAVIHETQRFIDLLPMGMPRKTTKDITYRGYFIPKNTNVFPMLTSVLKDPTCFPYATEFNPKNFLDENGGFKKNAAFMPLAAGKRICMGEGLVRVELFLMLITILQSFTLKSPIPLEDLVVTPDISGLGNLPKLYEMAFIPR